ncbi:MAG: glycerol acyltransferase [Clostridia bacterium]|nr:glycerol acyltransferase [Clostridia bacterium]
MNLYGLFAHSARFVYKIFKPHKVVGKIPDSPSVFVVHHQNMSGPVHALLTLPVQAHIWVLKVFFDRKECFNQYMDYTFTKRFGMPKILAAPLAFIISLGVPMVMHSFSAIPVNRSSRDILKTFQLSQKALIKGENLIISPDVDYDDDSRSMGDIYTGFLHLEKNYFKETKKHLSFVPMSYNTKERTLFIGKAIQFDDKTPYNTQKEQVAKKIKNSINAINKS